MRTSTKSILAISMTLMSLSTFSAQASLFDFNFGKKPQVYINDKESVAQAQTQQQVLQALQVEMTTKFDEIEDAIAKGNTKAAYLEAKEVLDSVRIKTGIDPKVRIQESFLAPTIFPKDARGMNDLSDAQKNLVIKTISDFRGGLYMDIMNLSKRTTLLYIRAFEAELSKEGGLTADDNAKIINDLVKAAVMPMPVEDKVGNKIFVFDEDVANEDHTYIFNRELKMFLIENSGLNVTEKSFDQEKEKFKASITGKQKKVTVMDLANACMANAQQLQTWDSVNHATVMCFDKYVGQTTSMNECMALAQQIQYSDSEASRKNTCFNKFN